MADKIAKAATAAKTEAYEHDDLNRNKVTVLRLFLRMILIMHDSRKYRNYLKENQINDPAAPAVFSSETPLLRYLSSLHSDDFIKLYGSTKNPFCTGAEDDKMNYSGILNQQENKPRYITTANTCLSNGWKNKDAETGKNLLEGDINDGAVEAYFLNIFQSVSDNAITCNPEACQSFFLSARDALSAYVPERRFRNLAVLVSAISDGGLPEFLSLIWYELLSRKKLQITRVYDCISGRSFTSCSPGGTDEAFIKKHGDKARSLVNNLNSLTGIGENSNDFSAWGAELSLTVFDLELIKSINKASSSSDAKIVMLSGDVGCGKTTLLRKYSCINENSVYFNASEKDLDSIVMSVSQELRRKLPVYRLALYKSLYGDIPFRDAAGPEDLRKKLIDNSATFCVTELLTEPFAERQELKTGYTDCVTEHPCIIIDSLDETSTAQKKHDFESINRFISALSALHKFGVTVIIACRNGSLKDKLSANKNAVNTNLSEGSGKYIVQTSIIAYLKAALSGNYGFNIGEKTLETVAGYGWRFVSLIANRYRTDEEISDILNSIEAGGIKSYTEALYELYSRIFDSLDNTCKQAVKYAVSLQFVLDKYYDEKGQNTDSFTDLFSMAFDIDSPFSKAVNYDDIKNLGARTRQLLSYNGRKLSYGHFSVKEFLQGADNPRWYDEDTGIKILRYYLKQKLDRMNVNTCVEFAGKDIPYVLLLFKLLVVRNDSRSPQNTDSENNEEYRFRASVYSSEILPDHKTVFLTVSGLYEHQENFKACQWLVKKYLSYNIAAPNEPSEAYYYYPLKLFDSVLDIVNGRFTEGFRKYMEICSMDNFAELRRENKIFDFHLRYICFPFASKYDKIKNETAPSLFAEMEKTVYSVMQGYGESPRKQYYEVLIHRQKKEYTPAAQKAAEAIEKCEKYILASDNPEETIQYRVLESNLRPQLATAIRDSIGGLKPQEQKQAVKLALEETVKDLDNRQLLYGSRSEKYAHGLSYAAGLLRCLVNKTHQSFDSPEKVLETAEDYQKQAISIREFISKKGDISCDKNELETGKYYYYLAELYYLMGKIGEALQALNKAVPVLEKYNNRELKNALDLLDRINLQEKETTSN